MKTWRELLGSGPNRAPDIDEVVAMRTKGPTARLLSLLSPLPGNPSHRTNQPFVTNVASIMEIRPDAGIYAESDQEHGKSWDTWIAEQRARIFDEGRATRVSVPEEADTAATTFQRSFYQELAEISADSERELLETASRGGIPAECCHAFWRSKQRLKKRPTT